MSRAAKIRPGGHHAPERIDPSRRRNRGLPLASSQRKSYDSVEGVLKRTFSQNERGKSDLAGTARWFGLGLAAVGLVLAILPERKG